MSTSTRCMWGGLPHFFYLTSWKAISFNFSVQYYRIREENQWEFNVKTLIFVIKSHFFLIGRRWVEVWQNDMFVGVSPSTGHAHNGNNNDILYTCFAHAVATPVIKRPKNGYRIKYVSYTSGVYVCVCMMKTDDCYTQQTYLYERPMTDRTTRHRRPLCSVFRGTRLPEFACSPPFIIQHNISGSLARLLSRLFITNTIYTYTNTSVVYVYTEVYILLYATYYCTEQSTFPVMFAGWALQSNSRPAAVVAAGAFNPPVNAF